MTSMEVMAPISNGVMEGTVTWLPPGFAFPTVAILLILGLLMWLCGMLKEELWSWQDNLWFFGRKQAPPVVDSAFLAPESVPYAELMSRVEDLKQEVAVLLDLSAEREQRVEERISDFSAALARLVAKDDHALGESEQGSVREERKVIYVMGPLQKQQPFFQQQALPYGFTVRVTKKYERAMRDAMLVVVYTRFIGHSPWEAIRNRVPRERIAVLPSFGGDSFARLLEKRFGLVAGSAMPLN